MQLRNQFSSYELPFVTNQYGSYGEAGSFETITLEELYARGHVIADSTGCHVWTRAKTSGWLYGVINLQSQVHGKKSYNAHGLALALASGDRSLYSSDAHALHQCDTPSCVNPAHLRWGTNTENIQDKMARYSGRPTWDATWLNTARVVSWRSMCVRRQAGAVLVGPDNRIVATGFNGKPNGLDLEGACDLYCPRAQSGGAPGDYSDDVFVHAETNALMYSDRTRREGGTAYVTSCPCWDCAKSLSNSGVARVVFPVMIEDVSRKPEKSIEMMMASGLEVVILYTPKLERPSPQDDTQAD